MRAIAWAAGTVARLLMIVGALCLLAIVAAIIGYLFGERSFPAPFSETGTGLGAYTFQVGAMVIGSWFLWRLCLSVVVRTGQPRDVFRTFGREDEWDQWQETDDAGAPVGRCNRCDEEFTTWDDALEHAERVHGEGRLPEEARAFLERY